MLEGKYFPGGFFLSLFSSMNLLEILIDLLALFSEMPSWNILW